MKENSKLEVINDKKMKVKLFFFLNLVLCMVLTIFGTVSIVSFTKFLYEFLNFNIFICLLAMVSMTMFYSFAASKLTKFIDKKIDNIKLEVEDLTLEYKRCLDKDRTIKDIKMRFETLPREQKLKLLNFIKTSLTLEDVFLQFEQGISQINSLDDIDITLGRDAFYYGDFLNKENISGYSRKKEK